MNRKTNKISYLEKTFLKFSFFILYFLFCVASSSLLYLMIFGEPFDKISPDSNFIDIFIAANLFIFAPLLGGLFSILTLNWVEKKLFPSFSSFLVNLGKNKIKDPA